MTGGTVKLVGRVRRLVGVGFSQYYVSVYISSGGFFSFMVRDPRTGELVAPMPVDGDLDFNCNNGATIMGAFPARLGTSDGQRLNVYHMCDVTDLSEMPTADGLLEALPNQIVTIDGLREVDRLVIPFAFTARGVVHKGVVYDRIEVGYRYPSDPLDIPGVSPGSLPKGNDSMGGSRGYGPAHSFGVIRLVDRVEVARWLAADGIVLNPADDRDWSAAKLDDLGLREQDIDLEGMVTE